ncbi:helix-turn-helix domain-containing protein [Candidatus Hydrogenedentota bacterium]
MLSRDDDRYLETGMKSESDLMKMLEVSELLRVSPATLVDWIAKEALPVIKLGRGANAVLRFQRGQVIQWAFSRSKISTNLREELTNSGFLEEHFPD